LHRAQTFTKVFSQSRASPDRPERRRPCASTSRRPLYLARTTVGRRDQRIPRAMPVMVNWASARTDIYLSEPARPQRPSRRASTGGDPRLLEKPESVGALPHRDPGQPRFKNHAELRRVPQLQFPFQPGASQPQLSGTVRVGIGGLRTGPGRRERADADKLLPHSAEQTLAGLNGLACRYGRVPAGRGEPHDQREPAAGCADGSDLYQIADQPPETFARRCN